MTVVYVGSPALAATLSRIGPTQVIPLEAMPCDAAFASLAAMIFGGLGAEAAADVHRGSGGRIGPLLHMARMQGLRPPFADPPEEVQTLPRLTSDGAERR